MQSSSPTTLDAPGFQSDPIDAAVPCGRGAAWSIRVAPLPGALRPGAPTAAESARFLAHATGIGALLREHAVERPGGGITWNPPAVRDGEQAPRLGPDLYAGVLGIALFLAALDHVRCRDDHRELVTRAIAPLRRTLQVLVRDSAQAQRLRFQTGGFVGLDAFVYAFVRIGGWLGDPALVAEAHGLTRLLTGDCIAGDDHLDVVDGSAGAVLALLALDRVAPEANADGVTPLELASACAAHLLDRRASHEGRPRAWAGAGKPPLGGFAHGATGVAYALLRLYARTGDDALRDAALEGLAFERSLFDAGAGNWLDPRTGRLLEQSAWCHGAPGIALGRLGALEVHDARGELDGLLRSTRAIEFAPLDHLCCGNLGRADILLHAGQVLGDGGLLDDALALATRTAERAEAEGGFALVRPGEAPGLRPSLFHGISGVGFALLRLAAPGTLPCILRLE